ncbi:Protein of unknown function [Methylomagnum ishizawai]|uniref:DUF721 domain-containing protein n=1 Tax=Methylomagnum ishizawai TaxID=1760988 RepID=A0A1Y6D5K8_9GAMM|nr:DciA family protein [Methylomagnum ishizawai]SMF95832.1 Protein of unknown function [Methylomagnum ishizawai]
MADQPEPVRQHLRSEGLAALRTELDKQARLLQIVRQTLPESMREHCRHCLLEAGGKLLLYTESAAFAYQLRFYGPAVAAQVAEAAGLDTPPEVRVRNLTPNGAEQARYAKPKVFQPPPANVAELLRENAAATPHEDLREALLRLSRTVDELNRRGPQEPDGPPKTGPGR